jgi:hypothetical protein
LGIGQFKISTLQISHYRTNTSARKMWVLQFVLEIENSMTPMGKPHHALKVPWFLFWGRGVGGEMIFSFLLCSQMFLSSSQWIPIRFPICSLGSWCVPQGCSQ